MGPADDGHPGPPLPRFEAVGSPVNRQFRNCTGAALVRDFGGIRIDTERLAASGYAVELCPGSAADASRAEMYEMIHALYVRQLGELVVALVRHFDVDEAACWRRVRAASEDVLDRLAADPDVPGDRVERDADELFGETAAMMTMSAMRGEAGRSYVPVSNPLGPVSMDDA